MLEKKYALITGANRGIGRGIVKLFAQNKADIFVNSRTKGSLDNFCSELESKYGGRVLPIYFDVSKPNQVKQAFQKIIKISRQLDVVVNNAGILDNNLLGMVNKKAIHEIFCTNTFGPIYIMQYASRLMMKIKKGSIINISSIVGVNGSEGQIVYSGSKAALIGITRSAAKELAPFNIRVNAIAPGLTKTDMMQGSTSKEALEYTLQRICMRRIGKPEEIANVALFLSSELSTYMTGQVLRVDGGM